MANLAIKGHKTRGKEVIKLLEMLGGQTDWCTGILSHCAYFINKANRIDYTDKITDEAFFTLEEFLEKFPYKVGDKVMTDDRDRASIVGMVWDNDINDVFYEIQICNEVVKYPKELLQPYEEETFGECIEKTIQECLFGKEETMEEIKVNIPKGYEFTGVDDDKRQVIFTKIQPEYEYPKTYEECCKIIQSDPNFYIDTHLYSNKLGSLYKLLICRDAYWKIAGEEMGLGQPWEPDWDDENEFKYGLYHFRNGIMYDGSCINPTLLAFPTEEMRDAFYENFNELIEECKELL